MTIEQAFSPGTRKACKTVKRYIAHYFYGMFAKSFNSGILAVDAAIGLAVGASVSPEVAKPTLLAILSIFGVSYGRSCLMWFKDHPIPEKLPDEFFESKPPFHPPDPKT